MPSFSFILTEKCNWKCEYCYFPYSSHREPNLETYKKHLLYIQEMINKLGELVVNIDIQGGEVGLIDPDILSYFFETIGPTGNKINVSTNGMFLKRGFNHWPDIREHLGLIMWHVADLKYTRGKIEDYYDPQIPISRGIVHDDLDEILHFVRKNEHILFDYVEFEFDIRKKRLMDKFKYSQLMNGLRKYPNVTENALQILERRLEEKQDHRENCGKFNHSIMIDLVNETIPFCQRQPSTVIPLTEENLRHRLMNFPKDIWGVEDWRCSSCTRLYAGKFYGNVIERALLTRKKLNGSSI